MEHVSRHMGHSSSTAEKYYRAALHGERSLKAYNTIRKVIEKVETEESFTERYVTKNETPSCMVCREFLQQQSPEVIDKEVLKREGKALQDRVRNKLKKSREGQQ